MEPVLLKINGPVPEEWNEFVQNNDGCFLESIAWKEMQQSLKKEVFLFALFPLKIDVFKARDCLVAGLALKNTLPGGFFYYFFPRGPVVAKGQDGKELIEIFLGKVKEFNDNKKLIFSRLEPQIEIGETKNWQAFKKSIALDPQTTGILDITPSEEELFSSFKPKTRYNIRLAEKNNVKISKNDLSFDDLKTLMEQTSKRDAFNIHPMKYYKVFFENAGKERHGLRTDLYCASHEGDTLAVAIVAIFGKKAYYLHGASSDKKKNLMAPHLMHWEIIKDLKKAGTTTYDLWGMNPKDGSRGAEYKRSLEGVTRFKTGFNPKEISFAGTLDYIYNKRTYGLYRLARKIRRMA